MKRLFAILAVVAVIFLGRDIYRWHYTLQRMGQLCQLAGKTTQEARLFLETNQVSLAIDSIREYNVDNQHRLIVSLNKVSILGVLYFWISGPDGVFSGFEISGLYVLPIESDRIVGCVPFI